MSSEYDELLEAETDRMLKKFDGRDDELREELSRNGLGHLPLSVLTRKMLIKRLATKVIGIVRKTEASHPISDQVESLVKDEEKSDVSLSDCSTSLDNQNKTHYAICIPGPDNQILVENNRLEVLKKMKEHTKKKPRMLIFSNYAEAAAFANRTSANDVCERAIVRTSYPEEKAEREVNESVPFPSVGVPQLNQLRVLLEKGNVTLARHLMLNNPRYLIATGDVPTILKIGPRFNALHACAFVGQLDSCKLIMELISDVEYLQKMYGTPKRAEEYSIRLVDLYINTPDKLANKTPLHFASEKGFVEMVTFLVSFRACNRTTKQQEIACNKYYGVDKADLTNRIQSLIKDGTCYVPLVRSDTTGPYAKIAKPFSPSSPHNLAVEIEECLKPSPSDSSQDMKDFSNLRLWAAAGPMSPQEAQEFRRDWWSPRAVRKGQTLKEQPFLNITDADRGFEHYGRKLADSHDVPWQEYWPFLDAFLDMRSLEGLKKLEAHLMKQRVVTQYESFKARDTTTDQEPLRVNKDFVLEAEEIAELTEDSDSFVSAKDFEEERNLKETQTSPSEDNAEGNIVFHDCNESQKEDSKKDQLNSSFHKLWNGLSKIKLMFSPSKVKSGTDTGTQSLQTRDVTSSLSSPLSASHFSLSEGKPTSDCQLNRLSRTVSLGNNVKTVEDSKARWEESSIKLNSSSISQSTAGDNSVPLSFSNKQNIHTSGDINSNENLMSQPAASCPESSVNANEESITPVNSFDKILESSDTSITWPVKSSADCKHRHSNQDDNSNEKENPHGPFTSTPVKELIYRNSGPIITSPDELSNSNEEGDGLEIRDLKSKQDFEKEMPSQVAKSFEQSTNIGEDDESFKKNMSFLCHGLENFKFQSPPCSSPAEICIVDHPETLNIEEKPTPRTHRIHIFTDTNPSHFMSEVESKLSLPSNSGVKSTVMPILLLRQGNHEGPEKFVLGDIYLPLESVPQEESLVMPEAIQKEVHANVWLNFLVSFPTWTDVNLFTTLSGTETAEITVAGLPVDTCHLKAREKEFNFARLKDAFLNSSKIVTDKETNCLQCKVVRSSSIRLKDNYVCGMIPTKMDGDVYRALNDKAVQLIENTEDLSAVKKWYHRMKMNVKDIESLPSPSRVLRSSLQKQGSLPLSPLVSNGTPESSKLHWNSPCSSKMASKDPTIRKLFQ